MQHIKTYYAIVRETPIGALTIEGPLTASALKNYTFHEHLTASRRPADKQFAALMDITGFPEGRIIIARTEEMIVSYVTYVHPDPLER